MPAGVALELAQSNITGADYPQILSVDPFAYGATTIDPARFKFQTQLPYVPVPLPGQFPTLTRFSISKSLATGTVVEAGSS